MTETKKKHPGGRPTIVLKLSEIKEYEYNNKDHPKEQIDLLVKMISEYGYDSEIIVNKDNVIIAGHARLKALQKLGREECEVKVKDKLSKSQERKYRLLDNKISELAKENRENIEIEIKDLEDQELAELYDIDLNAIEYDEEKEDEIPVVTEDIIVKRGDIFQLGDHRIMCGDSTDKEDVDKLMDGNKADMVFTDPPYNTGMKSNDSTRLNHMFNDSFTDDERFKFMDRFVDNLFESQKEGSVAYICLDRRRNYQLIPYLKKDYDYTNCIIWDKVVHGLGSDYKYTYEVINVCKKGKVKLDTHQGDREYSDVWHIQRKMGKDTDHATKKPIELIERCLLHGSKKNNICLDLFLGSGSTLIACEKTNRICYGMEIDEHYIQVIIKRYHDYTKGLKEIKCINRVLDISIITDAMKEEK